MGLTAVFYMPKLGLFAYIDDSGDAITEDIVLVATDTEKINVKYKNDSSKLVSLDANDAKIYVEDSDGNEVMKAENAALDINPGASKKLFADLELDIDATKSDAAKLHPGKAYTVKLLLDGELQDETVGIYVKDNTAKAESVSVGNVTAEFDATKVAELVFPVGFDLTELDADSFDVGVTNNGTFTVAASGSDWAVTIKAEDGTTVTAEAATISVRNYEKATGDSTAVILSTIADVNVSYTANDSGEVKEVKIEGEKLVAGQFVDDGSKVTLKAAYLTALVEDLADGDELEMTIKFADGTVLEVTVTVHK